MAQLQWHKTMAYTNQDIIIKLTSLEGVVANMVKDMGDVRDDIKQIKKDTANVGLVKSIVFGMVIIIMLAFMGGVVNLVLTHPTQTSANNLPAVSIQKPGK